MSRVTRCCSATPKEHTAAFSHRVAAADAFVLVTSEYNHGHPASLKNALDYLNQEWRRRPVAFVAYGGVAADARAVEQLRSPCPAGPRPRGSRNSGHRFRWLLRSATRRTNSRLGGLVRSLRSLLVCIVAGALLPLAISSPAAAAAWSGTITLATTGVSYSLDETPPTVYATTSETVFSPYKVSIYDDLDQLINWCDFAAGCSAPGSVPVNTTRTYVAYVALDAPSTGPPVNDVRATSGRVSVSNTGYQNNTIVLYSTRPTYGYGDSPGDLTVTVDPLSMSPYKVSIYDDLGQRMTYCDGYAHGCAAYAASVAPSRGTRSYVAYVAQDAPTTGPPSVDVRVVSDPLVVSNSGWQGS